MLLQLIQEMLTLIGGLIVFYFAYVFLTRKNDKPAAADTPSMAHTALRELVERAVDEARKLPGLGDSVTIKRQNNANISEQSYEDLLAAAILNRVVEKYQKSRVDDNSNVVHETTTRRCKRSEMSGEEASSADDAMSQDDCSSECSGKIKSRLVRVQQEPLSLTIEEQIEEVTTTYTSDEEPRNVKENILNFRCSRRVPFPEFGMDIVDPSQESSEDSEDDIDGSTAPIEHITPLETWEENWLFQKKRIATQSEPVAMLVPNPSEDYRALIGDKDADDMSDLSEFSAGQSDAEEIDEDLIEAINRIDSPKLVRVPINNNTVILNDNFTCEISHENSNTIPNDGVNYNENVEKQKIEKNDTVENNEVKNDEAEKNLIAPSLDDVKRENNNQLPKTPTVTPTRNSISESEPMPVCDLEKLNEKLSAIDDNIEEEMVIETKEVNHEFDKSLEFIHKSTEKMDTSYAKCTAKLSGDEQECSLVSSTPKVKLARSTEAKLNDEGPQLSTPPRPGTIAEREHKKWENAPPIQNNPYSQENIQKRLLERQYSRRSSDVSGVLPTSPSPPLQIVLGVNRPDVQRFARDYYINEAKSPTGERRLGQGTSSSSRPSSSLSLNSTSTSSDYEHQESFEQLEAPSSKSQNNLALQETTSSLLERERKNSKNEINAKLNNRGNSFDGNSFLPDENNRKIRRIDLRAYGFENEFDAEPNKKPQRVVNKLDLRSYGYDSGLRRTQSNNHIDSKVNNSFLEKLKNDRINGKSNLTQNHIWTQSTENLDKMMFDKSAVMKSAKSVPNIAKFYNKIQSDSEEDIEARITPNIRQNDSCQGDSYDSDSQNSRTESAEELPPKFSRQMKYSLEALESDRFIDSKLPMPSVRRLAEVFKEIKPTAAPRTNKSSPINRPTTPEVHIVKTPRQMHSLTARSLSREFREGLRQISTKPNAQPVYSTIVEQSKDLEEKSFSSPGNLKNNIQFWEELQRKQ